ncbi:MAG TPA: CcdB family protein [Rhizomicrobium sp.]
MTLKQFDVFPNPSARTRLSRPYFVVLQSDQLSQLSTRLVAPLVTPATIRYLERMMPEVTVEGRQYVVMPQELGPIVVKAIPAAIANLESERYRLIAALDLVFTGV